eukprot:jgi/Botrbrau1/2582/Bobra.145_1s0010.1
MPGRGWVRGLGAIFCLQRSPGCGSGMGINNLAFLGRHAWLKHNVKDLMVILHRLYLMHNFLFKVVHASDMECGFCSNIEYAANCPWSLEDLPLTGLESHSGTGAVSRIFMPAEDWKVPVCQASTPTNCGICGLLVPVSQSDTSLTIISIVKSDIISVGGWV